MEKYVLLNVVISLMIERYASCFHSASCCFCFSALSFVLSAVIRSSIIVAVSMPEAKPDIAVLPELVV